MTYQLSSNPMPPWHLWGSSVTQTLTFSPALSGAEVQAGSQLARINYRRPETWSFLIGARILGGDVELSNPTELHIGVNLVTGIGRSATDTEESTATSPFPRRAFVAFRWLIPPAVDPLTEASLKYTTQALGSVLDEAGTTDVRTIIDHFPAQDIQCSAVATFLSGGLGKRLTFEVFAYFAPMHHMRPDWFGAADQFRGEEVGGT